MSNLRDHLALLDDGAIACTLDHAAMPGRLADWEDVLGRATAREQLAGGVSVRFPAEPPLAGRIAELAAAEQRCCAFFTFSLGISSDGLRLDVTAPPAAAPIVTELFGASTTA